MEYHILNVAGRLAVAPSRNALLLVTCLLAVACNFSISPAVRQARREVDHHFEFIRPVTGGFDIASCTGSMVRTVRVPNPSRIRSFTPDYSGFVLSQAEWESESTLRLSVKVKDIPNITWEVVEECRTQIFGDPADLRYEGAEGIAVCVRVLDSCELERQVTIIKRQSRPAELRAITTVTPLRKQLTSIRAEKPEADDETVCRSVTVQSYAPSNTVVHEVEKLVAELKRIEVKPTIDGPFVIHGNQYQLWIFSAGNHSYFSFSGIPGSADSEMENPLERWADQLLRLIGFKCK